MARKEIIHKAGSIVDGMISNYVPDEICNSYYRGFTEGATLADKTLIEKACEWLRGYLSYEGIDEAWSEILITNFRKAMEE